MMLPLVLSLASISGSASLSIAILGDLPGDHEIPDLIRATGGRAVVLSDLADLGPETLLVLAECRSFPAGGSAAVGAFLERGGHLLAVGGPAFQTPAFRGPGGTWLSEDELLSQTPIEHVLVDWTRIDLSACPRGTSQPQAAVRYARDDGGLVAEVEMVHVPGWETIELACEPVPSGHNVLRFRLSGAGATESLLVEVRERDGSRWMAVVPVPRDQEAVNVGLAETRFRHWAHSFAQGRGGKGDHLRLANAEAVLFGFASSHQPIVPGLYRYSVHELGTCRVGALDEPADQPKLEGLCPPYKTFTTVIARAESVSPLVEGIGMVVTGEVVSPVARPMHWDANRDTTWRPWVKGFDTEGRWCATPVSTTWRTAGGSWTFVGFHPPTQVLAAFARRLAQALPYGLDRQACAVRLLSATETGSCVQVQDGQFVLNGARWFGHGINYWPLYIGGMEKAQFFEHWLDPRFYSPDLIEPDLAQLAALGINLVSIQYSRRDQAPSLRDFVTRCGRYGIKVNVYLGGAHPTNPPADDLAQRPFVDLLRAADLAGNPHVFGYDLAWEPHLGRFAARRAYDATFAAWLVEQYGSIERAEAVWGVSANREDGTLTGPTDEQLQQDGPHRLMVAAYRRFADDLISRRYREVIRLARQVDATHLFGARTGYGGTGTPWIAPAMPFDLISGAAHLDFISPEGYGYGPGNIADAALITQYARWAGHGKPVFWAELGQSVWEAGQSGLRQQAELYGAFAEMLRRTACAGWAGWWFPGGYRVDENSDYGIIAPDRTLRPAAVVLAASGTELQGPVALDVGGEALQFDRDAHPLGVAGIVVAHQAAFRAAYARGRLPHLVTRGSGTTVSTCPFTGLGGVPYEPMMPAQFVNGEIEIVERCAGHLRLRLHNTGEAAWADGEVTLLAGENGPIALGRSVPRYAYAELEIKDPGAVRLALHAVRFGSFGERISLASQ